MTVAKKWVAAGSYLTTDSAAGRIILDTANLGNDLAVYVVADTGHITMSLARAEDLAAELTAAVREARTRATPPALEQDPLIP